MIVKGIIAIMKLHHIFFHSMEDTQGICHCNLHLSSEKIVFHPHEVKE